MKVKSEDILKPGAVLKVELVDWSKVAKPPKPKKRGQKYYDNLRKVITI